MKINSSLVAVALGLASASLANATQYIYFTGSTAARDAVYNTLIAGVGFDHVPNFVGYGSAVSGNCSTMEFSNTISGTPTIVKCRWSGSEAGISDVSGSGTQAFLGDPGTSGVATTGTSSTAATGGQLSDVHTVDLAQADNAITFSKLPTSNASQLSDSLAIPFVFVKSPNTLTDNAAFTNITSDNFKNLANGGDLLALYTGNPADVNNAVYLTGRDDNSGTRVNTFGITGFGIKTSPAQIILSGATPNSMNAISAGVYTTGQGQASGGTLANSLTDTTTSVDQINGFTGFIAVAYLGLADDATAEALTPPAVRLTYNGVAYSAAAVQNGTYTFWGNEYTLYKHASATYVTTFAAAVAAQLQNHTIGFEVPFSTMHVTRTGPTAPPIY